LIGLRYGQMPRFAEEELRGFILARIPSSGTLSQVRFLLRALRQGNRNVWGILIALALCAVILLLRARS